MPIQTLAGRGKALRTLLTRLRGSGYQTAVLKHAVPDWWSAEVENEDPGAENHLKLILARRLGLDVREMLENDRIVPDAPIGMRFKRSEDREGVRPPDEGLAFCANVARTVASMMAPSSPVPHKGSAIRNAILKSGAAWVTLDGLLEYCWDRKIAVLYVKDLPGRKGMDALVYRVNGRDVIVLVREIEAHAAWVAFLIAHELGHIGLNHVRENEALADTADDPAHDESSANAFALDVMGSSGIPDFWSEHGSSAKGLAEVAFREAPQHNVDPEHVILRFGKEHDDFGYANKAIKYKRKHPSYPMRTVNSLAAQHLDVSRLGDDAGDVLIKVLQAALI